MINMPPYFGTIYSREHEPVVFTSNPFPYLHDEYLNLSNINAIQSSLRVNVTNTTENVNASFSVANAVLVETIRYKNWTWYIPDQVFVSFFGVTSASLNIAIAYKSHTQPIENMSVGFTLPGTVSLNTTIVYLNFNIPSERINLGFSIPSATLT